LQHLYKNWKNMADCTQTAFLYVIKSKKLVTKDSLTLQDKLQPGWRPSRSSAEWVNEGHEYARMQSIGDYMLAWNLEPGDEVLLRIGVLFIGECLVDGNKMTRRWNSAQWHYETYTSSKAGSVIARVTSMDDRDGIISQVVGDYFASQRPCPCKLLLEPASARNDPRLTVDGALTFDHVDWVACS
jgi:hypothetical protein